MNVVNAVSITALKTVPLFHGLPDDVLGSVARNAMMRRIPRGQAVVLVGERTDYVYFVLTGSLKVIVSDEDGREVILSILGQGELFGEMGMFGEQPRSASVVAVVSSDLVMISKSSFRQLMIDHFEVAWRMMDVYGRVARLLLEMAEKGEEIDGKTVVRKITKQDIARMIGASREMVSRVMKDLSNQGLINETENGIELMSQRLGEI